MSIEFEDYSFRVKEALAEAGRAFVHEACGEIQARTRRNSRVDTGQTKASYDYDVDDSRQDPVGRVGSSYQNAIWEEFGTGEYAMHGDGRKGGWVYQAPDGSYHYTKGKKPNRPLEKAFKSLRTKLIRQCEQIFKDRLGG